MEIAALFFFHVASQSRFVANGDMHVFATRHRSAVIALVAPVLAHIPGFQGWEFE
jgi:hypothetical protein